jgi:hypothetical protein
LFVLPELLRLSEGVSNFARPTPIQDSGIATTEDAEGANQITGTIEIKAVQALLPLHRAQMLTSLKLARKHVGLLIKVVHLEEGVERFVFRPLCPLHPLWFQPKRRNPH